MGDDLKEDARLLVELINSYDSIGSKAIKNVMFPDDLIAAIHNHLGNVYQLIDSAAEAFNGAEQSLAYKHAQNELSALSNNLFTASQTGLISEPTFRSIDSKINALAGKISDITDPEYV